MNTIRDVVAQGPFDDANWDNFDQFKVPSWYRAKKLGIFIHWGVYAVPAYGSEWYARNMYVPDTDVHKHHVETYGPVDQFGYKDFIPQFKAEHYDATEWAEVFKESGAEFVMPVAEHHDGFAMYDTPWNRWNAKNMGPKRDVTAELAEAVRKQGMRFAVSTHREENCWFFNGGTLMPSDVQDPEYRDLYGPTDNMPFCEKMRVVHGSTPGDEWLDDWLVRTCELVDKFRPEVVFFDWWIEEALYAQRFRTFAAYYYNRCKEWGIEGAINFKNEAMPANAGVWDIERGQLKGIRYPFWQTDTSLAYNSWGYIEGLKYRTPEAIIHDFVDIVSKNGALLMNVGPRADGTIPQEQKDLLRELGGWMKINGEGIYDTYPWKIYGEGPTAVPEGHFAEKNRKDFGPEDLRFTTKDGIIYVHFLGWPESGEVHIKNFYKDRRFCHKHLAKVGLLGHPGEVEYTRDDEAMKVKLPAEKPGKYAWCLKLTPA
ncbi:alpha-L-fucosidase [Algisphaera agarilytica]|uniref:alpha-L-fucosidase n=1 Tax=Algisphaera agarilytica TaxID=1385975 RepID=A0A7X0H6W6_9BACT|nr:alpha-L-fucosidase [Algisphaera agarilytica]MBB6428934.1 alpha-L-fucosidase [Algisphaera agarilytica]